MFVRLFICVVSSLLITIPACDRSSGAANAERSSSDGDSNSKTNTKDRDANGTVSAAADASDASPKGENESGSGASAEGPSWAVDNAIYDFGEIWVGETVRHAFKFRNVGTEPLLVLEAKAHCSCSAADDYKRRIEPGDEGEITFVLKTSNKPHGPLHEYLNIKFNDPQKPEMRIYMKGTVRHVCTVDVVADGRLDPADAQGLAEVKSRKAYFGDVGANETLYRVLRLVNTSGVESLTLSMQPVPGTNFEATLQPIVPGKVFEVTVIGKPPYRTGYNNSAIRFQTNVPDQPIWSIPISAKLPERIEVVPSKIVANRQSYQLKTRPIKITNNGTTPFEVTGVYASDPNYRVTLLPPDPAEPKLTVVEVVLPAGEYFPPAYGEVIRIETTDAEKSLIEIMVLPALSGSIPPRPADKPLEFHPGKLLR